MAKFIVNTNSDTGNIELSGSKKIIGIINEAIEELNLAGLNNTAAHSLIAQYTPIELKSFNKELKINSEDAHHVIFCGIYKTSKVEIKKAINKALNNILETIIAERFSSDQEECTTEECEEIVYPKNMPEE